MLSQYMAWTLLFAGALGISIAHSQSLSWQPEKNVYIVVPAGAGGGLDRTGRTIQQILQQRELVKVPIIVENKPGGGGSVAMAYLKQVSGDGRYVAVTSVNLIMNQVMGKNPMKFTEFTPLAHLFQEYLIFAVNKSSTISTGKDLLDQLRKDPASVSIGIGSSVGGPLHMAAGMVMKAAGLNPRRLKVVAFKSNAGSVTALLGGHIDLIVAGPATALSPLKGGSIRPLAIAAPRRLSGVFSDIPTWREQGIDVVASTWRSVVGPAELTQPQISYWDGQFSALVETSEWKKSLQNNSWEADYRNSKETGLFWQATYNELSALAVDLGLVKP